MHAWELMERRLWPLHEAEDHLGKALTTPRGILDLYELLAILANAAAERDDLPERYDAAAMAQLLSLDNLREALQGISAAIDEGMRTERGTAKKDGPVDVILAELDRKDPKRQTSWQKVAGMGLIAGVDLISQRTCRPGNLVDWYIARQRYDDEQHRIKRRKR